jgi:hypothetical protein
MIPWQEFDARPMLVDPAIPDIHWDAEPMSEIARSAG